METAELLRTRRGEILRIAERHGVKYMRVVEPSLLEGRHAAGEVDLLVEPGPGQSLRDLGDLLMDLEELLGREVYVYTPNGLKQPVRERVLRDAQSL